MSRWMLTCSDCKVDFTRTEVSSDAGVYACLPQNQNFQMAG